MLDNDISPSELIAHSAACSCQRASHRLAFYFVSFGDLIPTLAEEGTPKQNLLLPERECLGTNLYHRRQ